MWKYPYWNLYRGYVSKYSSLTRHDSSTPE
jgi:hypothetical protein